MARQPARESETGSEGMPQRLLLSILETFFRRPIINLIPLVLMMALGAFTAFSAPKEYRSVGVLYASSGTLLADLTETANTPIFGADTPALVTSRTLNNLVKIDSFLTSIIENARLAGSIETGVLTRDEVRSSISAEAVGDNIVAISATSPRPEQSQLIAQGTVDSFVGFVVGNDIADATLSVAAYQSEVERAETELIEARNAFDEYSLANPQPAVGERPVEVELELERLSGNLDRAETAVQNAQDDVNGARLTLEVSRALVERKLDVLDEPVLPKTPQPRLQAAAMTMIMFTFLGALLSLALVVITAMLDRTVRTAGDLAKFDVEVLAVVPNVKR